MLSPRSYPSCALTLGSRLSFETNDGPLFRHPESQHVPLRLSTGRSQVFGQNLFQLVVAQFLPGFYDDQATRLGVVIFDRSELHFSKTNVRYSSASARPSNNTDSPELSLDFNGSGLVFRFGGRDAE